MLSLIDYYKENKKSFVWKNILILIGSHPVALVGLYFIFKGSPKLTTLVFNYILGVLGFLSLTAGAHRLWSHRSYKARWPLRLLLVSLNFLLYENPIIHWARDHRTHHKYSDTDADPHDPRRGLFFAHLGWAMLKKRPEVIEKGKGINFSDLYEDPVLTWQEKYYMVFMPLGTFILPVVIPVYFWHETLLNAFSINILRYLTALHMHGLVNSVAHTYGDRPYDKAIGPRDGLTVAALTLGEGLHNYHHTFPWDYRAAELGTFCFNFTKTFIDICAKIGWAYDLKAVPQDIIKKRSKRTGDGTHATWGWGDKDQSIEEYENAIVINR